MVDQLIASLEDTLVYTEYPYQEWWSHIAVAETDEVLDTGYLYTKRNFCLNIHSLPRSVYFCTKRFPFVVWILSCWIIFWSVCFSIFPAMMSLQEILVLVRFPGELFDSITINVAAFVSLFYFQLNKFNCSDINMKVNSTKIPPLYNSFLLRKTASSSIQQVPLLHTTTSSTASPSSPTSCTAESVNSTILQGVTTVRARSLIPRGF